MSKNNWGSVFHTHINEKNNHKIQPKFVKFKFNTYIICLKIIKLCLILRNFQEKKRKKVFKKNNFYLFDCTMKSIKNQI